ncbi:GNAT family N-acetyltransferase [Silvimonas sp. JCM 19000]
MLIRPLQAHDHAAWLTQWQSYCDFYSAALAPEARSATWHRIMQPDSTIHGIGAFNDLGELLGFCHYVCHPHTWSERTIAYLEDLFVAPSGRRLGVATALIEHLKSLAQAQGWRRIYWITDTDNAAARAVYDKLATRTDHVRYEIALA